MNPIITYITVDLSANNNFDYVRAVQGDNRTRYVHISLLNHEIPYDLSDVEPVLRGSKPDGTAIFNHCEISDDNEIIVELTGQILASAGTGKYEIALYKTDGENEVLTSFPFNIYVSPASCNIGSITSSDEFTELSDIIKNIDIINQNVESAKDSAINSGLSADEAAESAANASDSARQAGLSADEAHSSSELSKSWAIGETGIREGEDTDNAKYYSQLSCEHMNDAKSYMDGAEAHKNDAALSKDAASGFANTASEKAADALDYAELSKSYAVGTANEIRENDSIDNSKYYYEQIRTISNGLQGVLLPMGTITFSELQNQTANSGYMYNISDEFITDETFKDGSGYIYPAGTNVYYTADGYWDCLSGTMVTGIKGEAESTYKKGNVTITKENIGLENVENKSAATIRSEMTSEEIINALGYTPADSITNTVTGIKGNAESTFRTGNVNLTPANIGLGKVTNVAQMPASYWHWSGQDGQPSWIWGGNSSNNYYVYNPSNFKVSYANSAGNSAKIDSSVGNYIKFGNMWIKGDNDQQLELGSFAETNYRIALGVYDGSWTVCPKNNGYYNFGTANHRWGNVYVNYLSYNTMAQTSDLRKKQNVVSIDDKFHDFLMDLTPVFYRYIDDPQHLRAGLIAQDVEEKMKVHSIPEDFQLLIKTPSKNNHENDMKGNYEYALSYIEFIPILLKQIQLMQKEIDELKSKL